jgi:hypothetical protein
MYTKRANDTTDASAAAAHRSLEALPAAVSGVSLITPPPRQRQM